MASEPGNKAFFDDELDAEEVWFEDDLEPARSSLDGLVRGLEALNEAELAEALGLETVAVLSRGQQSAAIETFAREEARGQVRINMPGMLPVPSAGGAAFARGTPYLLRLGVEFCLTEEQVNKKYRYKNVWCRAMLAADDPRCLPRVLDVFPDRLYEGEPQKVRVEVKPSLKLEKAELSLGSIAADIQVGVIAPATLGYLGVDDRAPYWEMTEKQREILGRYHFWFLLDVPTDCNPAAVRLSVEGEGNMQFHMAGLALGPKRRRTGQQPWLTLAEVLGRGG